VVAADDRLQDPSASFDHEECAQRVVARPHPGRGRSPASLLLHHRRGSGNLLDVRLAELTRLGPVGKGGVALRARNHVSILSDQRGL
jgi:hypothetical protein